MWSWFSYIRSKRSTLKHSKTHTGEEQYRCDICSATLVYSSNLKVHYRTHTEDKPYKCEVCLATFNKKSDLKEHYGIHIREKPHKCEACLAAFVDLYRLGKHCIMFIMGRNHMNVEFFQLHSFNRIN